MARKTKKQCELDCIGSTMELVDEAKAGDSFSPGPTVLCVEEAQ